MQKSEWIVGKTMICYEIHASDAHSMHAPDSRSWFKLSMQSVIPHPDTTSQVLTGSRDPSIGREVWVILWPRPKVWVACRLDFFRRTESKENMP